MNEKQEGGWWAFAHGAVAKLSPGIPVYLTIIRYIILHYCTTLFYMHFVLIYYHEKIILRFICMHYIDVKQDCKRNKTCNWWCCHRV